MIVCVVGPMDAHNSQTVCVAGPMDAHDNETYRSGEFDRMGQEKMIRLDRRSCIWVRRV